MLLVSPQERPKEFFQLGRSSSLPEKYGCDFLFASEKIGLVGIQRKVFPDDFLASLRGDDRISRELQMQKQLDYCVWLLEGMGTWTLDDYLVYGGRYKYYRYELWGFQMSLGLMGYHFIQVPSLQSTCHFLQRIQEWAAKDDHNSLFTRPKPSRWGVAGSREWALHFLQGLPGVGYGLAERILDYFVTLPFEAKFTYEELHTAIRQAPTARVICELFGIEVPQMKVKLPRGSKDNRGRIVE